MNIKNFFNSDELELPRSWGNYPGSFIDFLEGIFNNYKKNCELLEPVKEIDDKGIVQRVQAGVGFSNRLIESICGSLKEYFNGNPSQAYEIFKESLGNPVSEYIRMLFSTDVRANIEYAPFSDLYRIRETEDDLRNQPLGLFHVPYNLRERIATQRYSIPGVPCLYLGGAIELCWNEIKRPDLKNLWVVRYKVHDDRTLRFLNCAYRPALWGACIDSNAHDERKDIIVANAVCWPLIAACSIIRRDPNSKFAPEYVVPQMLTQWVMNYSDNGERIDGIRYFSTKVLDYFGSIKSVVNYVFPAVKNNEDRDYSSTLAEKFKITSPIRISDLLRITQFINIENKLKKPVEIKNECFAGDNVEFHSLIEILKEYNRNQ